MVPRDIGELDADGYLSIVVGPRSDHQRRLQRVPREIEDVLREHPRRADVAVARHTRPKEWGEIVTAYVEAAGTVLDVEALWRRPRPARPVQATAPRPSRRRPPPRLGKVIRGDLVALES